MSASTIGPLSYPKPNRSAFMAQDPRTPPVRLAWARPSSSSQQLIGARGTPAPSLPLRRTTRRHPELLRPRRPELLQPTPGSSRSSPHRIPPPPPPLISSIHQGPGTDPSSSLRLSSAPPSSTPPICIRLARSWYLPSVT